jgi:nucleoside-diphosphate-sugar epimerase
MKIGISGYKGLIGKFLEKRLIEEGHEIVLRIDVQDNWDVKDLKDRKLLGEMDLFIHCAALCKINKTIEDPRKGFRNAEDTFSVLEFCRKNNVKKVMYFSSSRVLSSERNPYTAGKLFGEDLCKAYKDCYDIDYIIIRPSTVYGPTEDRTNRLMNIFITNALNGEDLKILGDPNTKTLDFTYVEDFVDGIILTLSAGWNKEYNISGGEEVKVLDLARFIIKETGSDSKIIIRDAEIAQPQKVHLDLSDIKKLGYNPKVDLWQGVLKNIDYLKKQNSDSLK